MTIELIDKSKIDFTTIEPYEYASEEMKVVFKEDIEEIPTIKAIPLEKIKEFRNYITKVNDITLIQKLNELIESEGK